MDRLIESSVAWMWPSAASASTATWPSTRRSPSSPPDEFAQLGTRVITLTPETKTANAIGDRGGAIIAMPNKAITIGIKQTLSARKVRLGVSATGTAAWCARPLTAK